MHSLESIQTKPVGYVEDASGRPHVWLLRIDIIIEQIC